MRRVTISASLSLLTVAAAFLPARAFALNTGAPSKLTGVVFATGFLPNVLFTPYYVAQDLGYYRKAGLSVDVNYDRVPNLLQALAQGTYQFASAEGDSIVPAQARHIPVVYIMAQYQRYPIGAMALKNGVSLNRPGDLRGRSVGISAPGSATWVGLRALLKFAGLTESDVKETAIGFAETEALINHQIDIAMTFIDNEPVQAAALGHPVTVLPVSRYLDLVGPGVATSAAMVKQHSKIVQGFVTATLQGLKFMLEHPDRAFTMAMKRQPEITDPAQIAIQRRILSARIEFQQPPKGRPLGWSDPRAWSRTISFLRGIGLIPAGSIPSRIYRRVFTDAFVRAARL